jgi:hypothetical protein
MFDVVEKLLTNADKTKRVPVEFSVRRARRPIRGQGQGTNYIEPYKPFLCELFMAGEAEKKHRKNPAQMLEALKLLHPEAPNLPGHGEISPFIGSLVSRAKKGKTSMPGTSLEPRL